VKAAEGELTAVEAVTTLSPVPAAAEVSPNVMPDCEFVVCAQFHVCGLFPLDNVLEAAAFVMADRADPVPLVQVHAEIRLEGVPQARNCVPLGAVADGCRKYDVNDAEFGPMNPTKSVDGSPVGMVVLPTKPIPPA
jgi:hypothetical protein